MLPLRNTGRVKTRRGGNEKSCCLQQRDKTVRYDDSVHSQVLLVVSAGLVWKPCSGLRYTNGKRHKLHMEDKLWICYLELKRGKRSGKQRVGGDVIFAEGMNTI